MSEREAIECAERELAAARLAGYLRSGQLALLLGAGVSHGLGLPTWDELVSRCEAVAGLAADSHVDRMRRMDTVRRKFDTMAEFNNVVHEQLYQNLDGAEQYPDELLTRKMLIALGALVMSSVRGSVTDVLTLNFDDVLDWYLHLHGFKTQIVTSLPQLVSGQTDVRILHLHGFLPLMRRFDRSDWILLTHDQLVERLSDHSAPWPVTIASFVQSKVMLVVGTSMQDLDLDVLIRKARTAVGRARPIGFVLDRNIQSDRADALREWGMTPVSFESHEDIPAFILDVCQRAAADSPHRLHMSGA